LAIDVRQIAGGLTRLSGPADDFISRGGMAVAVVPVTGHKSFKKA